MTVLVRRGVQVLVQAALQVVVLFVSAGTVRWPAGWLYVGLYVGVVAVGAAVLVPGHRDVVEERSRGRQGGVAWDRQLTSALTVAWLGILVVAGLAERWGWLPQLPSWLVAVGVAVFLLGSGIMLWAGTACCPASGEPGSRCLLRRLPGRRSVHARAATLAHRAGRTHHSCGRPAQGPSERAAVLDERVAAAYGDP